MRRDNRAVDTVFGALMLILVCFISSSFLISQSSPREQPPNTDDLEKKFDCILSSTLDAVYPYGGESVTKSVRLMDYLLELSTRSGGYYGIEPINNVTRDIASLVDFYMGSFDGWILSLFGQYEEPMEIASRAPAILHNGEIVVLERIIGSMGEVESAVRLSIAI